MHAAAEGGQLEMVKFLSHKFTAKVHDKNLYGRTVLHRAAGRGKCAIAQYLIEEMHLDPQDRDKVCVCCLYLLNRFCGGTSVVVQTPPPLYHYIPIDLLHSTCCKDFTFL